MILWVTTNMAPLSLLEQELRFQLEKRKTISVLATEVAVEKIISLDSQTLVTLNSLPTIKVHLRSLLVSGPHTQDL